jgi:hypothetical protein
LIASGKKQVVGYFFSLEINFLLFRHDWSFLKRLLSLQLKQVWGGMPPKGVYVEDYCS